MLVQAAPLMVLQVTISSTIHLQVPLHRGLVIASNYKTDKPEKHWQLKCTSLPTQSHLLQFVYSFFAPLHPFTVKSHRSSHWFRVITLVATRAAGWKRSGINEASDKSATETCVSEFNSACDGVLQFVEPLGFHYTKTNGWFRHSWILGMGRAGWGSRGRQLAYSVVACLKWRVSMQGGNLVRGGAQQRKWHICPLPKTPNCGKGSEQEK